jgi:hypothetical protein
MVEAERVSETLGSCPELTGLVAREDFIALKLPDVSSKFRVPDMLVFNIQNLCVCFTWFQINFTFPAYVVHELQA